eukprot:6615298-Ditylum_brightwellii.AAC.1
MMLKMHIIASYLSKKQVQSRAGRYFYLGNKHDDKFNRLLHIVLTILSNVMASAAEAKLGTLFEHAKEAALLRVTLQELCHPQPAAQIQVDNSTASRVVNSNMRQRKSKAIDTRFYLVQDRVRQGQYTIH